MTDVETLSERVRTVERAVTDGDHEFPAVDDLSELTDRMERIEARIDELDERTAELEAATQALRGYVGNVRSVNERVEQRADTALAATERLERQLEAAQSGTDSGERTEETWLEADDGRPRTAPAGESSDRRLDGPGDRDTGLADSREPSGRTGAPDGRGTTTHDDRESTDERRSTAEESNRDAGVLERIRARL